MVIILAEKPSAARNFAKALGGMKGVYKGESYEIVNAAGHLYSFPDKASKLGGKKYDSWTYKNIPWNPKDFDWRRYQQKGAGDLIKTIKDALLRADELVCATDVDPTGEGNLIFWNIANALNWKGKTSRMHHLDESEKEVRKAFENRTVLKSSGKDGDFLKADTRSKFDYLSMQLTVAATLAANEAGKRMVVREGRLKSVMVYLVGQQLELVNNYERIPFYTVRYIDENEHIYKRKDKDEDRYATREEVSLTPYHSSKVVVDKEEVKHSQPPTLMDLAALSSILARRGFKAKEVLSKYQSMYENQLLSYPRTEDKFVSPEQFNELLPLAQKIAKVVGVDTKLLTHTKPRAIHVKTGGAHGANRPGLNVPNSLDDIARKYGSCGKAIYETLAKNYLAILCEDYEYRHQVGHLKDYPDFVGTANIPVSLGYKAVYDADSISLDEAIEENIKPLGKNAEAFVYEGANPKPQNPTSNWLIGKNGKLTKFNVGTGATRTSTLSEITSSSKTQLMTENKGVLGLTEIGWMSYRLLNGCYIASPEVTEELLNNMELVGKFEKPPEEVINMIGEISAHDMQIMRQNAQQLTGLNPGESSKVSGAIKVGRKSANIQFNRTWSGHTFTEEEISALLDGKEIEITATSKSGNTFTAKGKLEEQTYKGKTFWGFKGEPVYTNNPDKVTGVITKGRHKGETVSFKKIWSGHTFTEKEIEDLLNGEIITIKAKSKSGKDFEVSGKLAQQMYKGKKFWGFKADF